MTGKLPAPTTRPGRLVAEMHHQSPRWIRSGHRTSVAGLCSRTLPEANLALP